jgi:hypothetical protein
MAHVPRHKTTGPARKQYVGDSKYSTKKDTSYDPADTKFKVPVSKPDPVAQVTVETPTTPGGREDRFTPQRQESPQMPDRVETIQPPVKQERSREQELMDRQNEIDAEILREQAARVAKVKLQGRPERRQQSAQPRGGYEPIPVDDPYTRPPRTLYQTLKSVDKQISPTVGMENEKFKYSLPSHTPLVDITGRDKTVNIRKTPSGVPYVSVSGERPSAMEVGWTIAKGRQYQDNLLSPDRVERVASIFGKELQDRYDKFEQYQERRTISRATRAANQRISHADTGGFDDSFSDWQTEEDRQMQTGQTKTPVTYDMILTARDQWLARSDITDAAKQIIRDTPIVATSGFNTMRANAQQIEYDPTINRAEYQDIDRIAGIFGHEAVHVLDDSMGDRGLSGYPGSEWTSDIWGGSRQTPFQKTIAAITQPAISKYTGRGDDIPEALYDPTNVNVARERMHLPFHQYTYFGEQKAWAIPPELQKHFQYFKEEAFKLPAGKRWEQYTAKDGFRKWRVVEKSGSEPSKVLPRQTITFTGAEGQTAATSRREANTFGGLYQGRTRYK